MEAQHAELAHEHVILRGVITMMLQDVATRIQQADKEQRGAEGKVPKRAKTTQEDAACRTWVDYDAPVASAQDTAELLSSQTQQLEDSAYSYSWVKYQEALEVSRPRKALHPFSGFSCLPQESQAVIMRHRRILKAIRRLCPDDYATHAAAVRDPDGLWAHFEAVCQAQTEIPDPYA